MVPLKNYVTVNGNWQKVSIPVKAFQFIPANPNGFQLDRVHSVGFYVDQNNGNSPFEIKVDNISFIKSGTTPPPSTRLWWSEDANHNGVYNKKGALGALNKYNLVQFNFGKSPEYFPCHRHFPSM